MDIRNWFTASSKGSGGSKTSKGQTSPKRSSSISPKKEVKKKKRRIVDSDSDEELQRKKSNTSTNGTKRQSTEEEVCANKKQKTSKKKMVVESSDEDCVIDDESNSSVVRHSPRKTKTSAVVKEQAASKPVSLSDFFGSAPVQHLSKKITKKAPLPVMKTENNHEDEDFSKTLAQLDSIKSKSSQDKNKQKKEENVAKKPSPKKPQTKASKKPLTKMEVAPPPASKPKEKAPVEVPKPEKKTPAKKGNSALYFSYLNRQGPTALGSKEIPEGEQECLKGKTFLITGVLESIERDDAKVLIEKYGGKVMTTLSKNTNYIVIGRDAGSSKLEKAVKLGTTQLDEDGLLDLIRTSPGTGPPKKKPEPVATVPEPKEECPVEKVEKSSEPERSPLKSLKAKKLGTPRKEAEEKDTEPPVTAKTISPPPAATTNNFEMWVDRYKPTSLKKLIGQQGPSSNANKLMNWLRNWKTHTKKKAVPSRWGGNNDGTGFKAALLSGPPGVGKTTTAQLVCKELGFDYFELNASDTRSKKSLQSIMSELLLNQSLSACFKADGKRTLSSNHAIIMDEVDGMAGNEDRGGIQELIGLIKTSKIPVICICNDRNHPKIRSLSNYCFDLRFQKPRVEQIKAAMLSIAYKEGLEITPNVINEVIVASNQDIRQVLHNLSVWCSKNKGLTEEQAKKDIGFGIKHVKMSPFDVLREVFAIGNNKKATINDKASLFFHDYSIAPLFVQENYVHVLPSAAGNDQKKHLCLLSEAADSICTGDLIDKQIRSRSSWNLLPVQAIFASVVPGELLTGHLRQMISFPSWLGKNSNRNHMHRILQELQMHMRMRITGDKIDVALDYLPVLKRALTEPLLQKESDGILDVLQVMNSYYLLREDFDSAIELCLWSHQKDPRSQISSKVKSAFTRAYNKHCQQNPYAAPSASKKKKKGAVAYSPEDAAEEGDEYVSEEEESEEDSIENSRMIKVKKQVGPKDSSAASSSKATTKKRQPKK